MTEAANWRDVKADARDPDEVWRRSIGYGGFPHPGGPAVPPRVPSVSRTEDG